VVVGVPKVSRAVAVVVPLALEGRPCGITVERRRLLERGVGPERGCVR